MRQISWGYPLSCKPDPDAKGSQMGQPYPCDRILVSSGRRQHRISCGSGTGAVPYRRGKACICCFWKGRIPCTCKASDAYSGSVEGNRDQSCGPSWRLYNQRAWTLGRLPSQIWSVESMTAGRSSFLQKSAGKKGLTKQSGLLKSMLVSEKYMDWRGLDD